MGLQQRQSRFIKDHCPWKRLEEDWDEWALQSSACSSSCAALTCLLGAVGQDGDVGRGWRSRGHLPLMQDRLSSGHRAGLPAPLAAPWAGHLLGTEAAAQGDTEGEDCSAEPGVLSICFARFQNESWLESFFSSCRNVQSLAHSPVCHFVLHHVLFQEVELPMIS